MSAAERERRNENIAAAHALLQAQLFWLTTALAGGYRAMDELDMHQAIERDAQDVVDAAITLKRVVLSGGEIAPVPDG